MTRNSFLRSFFLVMFLAGQFAVAQSGSNPDSSLQTILLGVKGSPLSLLHAVQAAIKNSTSVRKAEAAYLAAEGSERKEAGFFDPRLFFDFTYQDQRQPTASFFSGAPTLATIQTLSRSGLSMVLPIGTELQLAVNTTRLSTNSSLAFLNPEYDATGSFTLRQPLLGGFAASARKRLTQSERWREAEKARYDQQMLAVGAEVEKMYWDLYAAERDYAVQQLSRDRAGAFLGETELRARAGLVGPDQVANARTFLAEQELQLLERDEEFDRQSDQLASQTGVRPEAGAAHFIPIDQPSSDYSLDSVEILVEQAIKDNLDLQAAQKDVEAAQAVASAAGWEALPSINLVGSLGGTGLAGTGQQVIILNDTLPTPPTRKFSDALTQVGRREFPNWSIGVEVSVPIGLRGGLGEKDRLEAQVLSAQQGYIEKSRVLEEQIRSAYRELSHGKSRLRAARDGVEASEEQVRIGMIEFHNGRSTAFELVRLGEDLAIAQQHYTQALVRTAKAAATLRQLTSGRYSGSMLR